LRLRRVQEVGKGTLIVSLPKAWAKRYGVQKGSILAVRETAKGQLVLEPFTGREEEPASTTIRCDGKRREEVEWGIIGAYLLGYDTIELVARARLSSEVKSAIREAVRSLAGLEIVDEDLRRVVINCLVDPSAVAPRTLLARKNAITIGMHTDAVAALTMGDKGLAEMVMDRDEEVDRLYFLLVRLLRTAIRDLKLAEKFELTPIDCLDFRMAAKLIESIGDHAVDVASLAMRLPEGASLGAVGDELSSASGLLKEMQDTAVRAFLMKKGSLVGDVKGELKTGFSEALSELEERARDLEGLSHIVYSAASLMNEIAKCCIDIADLVVPAGIEVS